jgi:hypothetical protein
MSQYVQRRAFEHKQYRKVAESQKVGYEWLKKLAQGCIDNPGSNRIEKLARFYKLQEVKRRR